MTRARARVIGSEHGAISVQVGIALFVLMAFNVFVLDYGMLWIARGQAQNAADAGAIAGAIARAYEDPNASNGLASQIATTVAQRNMVWQEAGGVVTFDDNCPAGVTGKCVRVDVHRDGTNGSNQVPVLFGPILGITGQSVRATATAIVGNANATNCLKPWAMADQWTDARVPNNEFNRYVEPSPGTLYADPDTYTPPSATNRGQITGPAEFGVRLDLTLGDPSTNPITRQLVLPLDLSGAKTFEEEMRTCNGSTVSLGQTIPIDPLVTPTAAANSLRADVYDQDPAAVFDYGDTEVSNSCAPGCAAVSPRLLAIALYDPDKYQLGRATGDWTSVGCSTNAPCITVSNIVGYFIHCVSGRPCIGGSLPSHGHYVRYPGITVSAAPTIQEDGAWLVTTHLIR
jgi:Flp pilus assembly protein TadG